MIQAALHRCLCWLGGSSGTTSSLRAVHMIIKVSGWCLEMESKHQGEQVP